MIFGICCSFDDNLQIPHIDFIKKCGFDYVELALNSIVSLSEEKFSTLKAQLVEKNITCPVCNCFMPGEIKMTGENFDKEIFEQYVIKAAVRAKQLGCRKLVLGSGASRNIPSGFDRQKAYSQFTSCLDFIISQLKQNDIQLELEHLNRLESNVITSFDESTSLAREKSDDSFKSILDYFHFAVGNESLRLIEDRAEYIGHIHFARPLGRVYPEIGDLCELKDVLSAIKNSGYNDTFSMECAFPDMNNEPLEYRNVLEKIKEFFAVRNIV